MPQFKLCQKAALPDAPRPIVLIGAGGIARDAHLPAYRKANFPVTAIYDLNLDRAQSLAHEFAVGQAFSSIEEAIALAPGNAVFDVAVPASAITAVLSRLPVGRAVLIQKPMGENLDEARAILALCEAKKFRAAINLQLRYAPYVLAARSLIEQGAIGDLHDMEARVCVYTPWHLWSFLNRVPGAEIFYHSIHYLDLLRSFLGEPRGVYAKTLKHPLSPQLNSARSTVILDYGDTVRACVATDHGHAYGPRHQESFIKWEGTRGAIVARMGLNLNYPAGEPDVLEYCTLENSKPPRWQSVALEGSWMPDAFIGTMASVMRWADDPRCKAPTAVDDAFKTMAVADAAFKSSEHGGQQVALQPSATGRST